MRTMSSSFVTIFASATALLAVACSSSNGTTPGGGGGSTGGGGTGGTSAGFPLTAVNGFVNDPTTGVVGAWFAYGDSVGPNANTTTTDLADSDCVKKGGFPADGSDCTQIDTPTPGQPFPQDSTGALCTSGTAAVVLDKPGTSTYDYSDLWGGGMGLDFNNPGGDAGTMGTFDLSKYGGLSFDFSGTVIPSGKIRVNFPFSTENAGTDSPYWAANSTDDHSTIAGGVTPGHNVVMWSQVLGPYYLTQQTPKVTPPAYDPTKAWSIEFQVFTNVTAAVPYAFCVNNLTLLPLAQ
jgi:hypothetical protein